MGLQDFKYEVFISLPYNNISDVIKWLDKLHHNNYYILLGIAGDSYFFRDSETATEFKLRFG